jgi:hypothetical protein
MLWKYVVSLIIQTEHFHVPFEVTVMISLPDLRVEEADVAEGLEC